MSITAVCPGCASTYELPDDLIGKRVRCKKCAAYFVVGVEAQVTIPDAGPVEIMEDVPAVLPAIAQSPPRRQDQDYVDDRRPLHNRRGRESGRRKQSSGAAVVFVILAMVLLGLAGAGLIGWWFISNLNEEHAASRPVPRPKGGAGENQARAETPVMEKRAPHAVEIIPNPKPPAEDWNKGLGPKLYTLQDFEPRPAEPGEAASTKLADRIPPEVLQKVKKATAYIRVKRDDGRGGSGSGFCAGEKGLIMTNAHVLGMKSAGAERPKSVEVILNSGEPDEQTLAGQILGVDAQSDLAVLRVKGDNLPEPLAVDHSKHLLITQPVWVFGFPFGESLGKNITVSNTNVSSLRTDANGTLHHVQVSGGMNPGNSGGPVVDARGHIVGVSVAIRTDRDGGFGRISNTQINFAIPGEHVQRILYGRAIDMDLGLPVRDGDQLKIPVAVQVYDPVKRLRSVELEWWIGAPGDSRPATSTAPEAKMGDEPRQTLKLSRKDNQARGDLVLPPLASGKVVWLQPKDTSRSGATTWGAAKVLPLYTLERTAVSLAVKRSAGQKANLRLYSKLTAPIRDNDGDEHALAAYLQGELTETVQNVNPEFATTVRLEYRDLTRKWFVDNHPAPVPDLLGSHAKDLRKLTIDLLVDRHGNHLENKSDASSLPADASAELTRVHESVQQALDTLAVTLPDKEIAAGQAWKVTRPLPLRGLQRSGEENNLGVDLVSTLELLYHVMGVRERDGRKEVILAVEGTIFGNPNDPDRGLDTPAKGYYVVDLATGLVTSARLVFVLDRVHGPLPGLPFSGNGTLELQLERTLSSSPDKK